ncbi:MAG TPA: hypothetical protein VG269_01100 [Tepidisphaeraceae bacterium]|nr:hypothetical protein [Tepidisphaeraceae bacterium]
MASTVMVASGYPTSGAPAAGQDDLATVVVRRLERRRAAPPSWGLVKTIVLGVPTFGLLPLLVWPFRFREYVTDEAEALQELAEWARARGRRPAAVGPLMAAAEDTSFKTLPLIISMLLAIFVVGAFFLQFTNFIPFTLDSLLGCTYYYTGAPPASPFGSRIHLLYLAWCVALSLGYVLHWAQVRGHVADVTRFVARFNPVVEAEGLPPVRGRRLPVGIFRPLWVLAAIMLAVYGAWWGIPMVLAGMAQRRYTNVTGRAIRWELARRVKDMASMRGEPIVAQAPPARRCGNPRCLATLPPAARFCTRCGTADRAPA